MRGTKSIPQFVHQRDTSLHEAGNINKQRVVEMGGTASRDSSANAIEAGVVAGRRAGLLRSSALENFLFSDGDGGSGSERSRFLRVGDEAYFDQLGEEVGLLLRHVGTGSSSTSQESPGVLGVPYELSNNVAGTNHSAGSEQQSQQREEQMQVARTLVRSAAADPLGSRAQRVSVLTRVVAARLKLIWLDLQGVTMGKYEQEHDENQQSRQQRHRRRHQQRPQNAQTASTTPDLAQMHALIVLLRLHFSSLLGHSKLDSNCMYAVLGSSFLFDEENHEDKRQKTILFGRWLAKCLLQSCVETLCALIRTFQKDVTVLAQDKTGSASVGPFPVRELGYITGSILDLMLVMLAMSTSASFNETLGDVTTPVFAEQLFSENPRVQKQLLDTLTRLLIGRDLFCPAANAESKAAVPEICLDPAVYSPDVVVLNSPPKYILALHEKQRQQQLEQEGGSSLFSVFGYQALRDRLLFGKPLFGDQGNATQAARTDIPTLSRASRSSASGTPGRWTPADSSSPSARHVRDSLHGLLDHLRDQALLLLLLCTQGEKEHSTCSTMLEELRFRGGFGSSTARPMHEHRFLTALETCEEYLWMDERGAMLFYTLFVRNSSFRAQVLNPLNGRDVAEKIVLPCVRLLTCVSGSLTEQDLSALHARDADLTLSSSQMQSVPQRQQQQSQRGASAACRSGGRNHDSRNHELEDPLAASTYISHVLLVLLTEVPKLVDEFDRCAVNASELDELWQIELSPLHKNGESETDQCRLTEVVVLSACQSIRRFASDQYVVKLCSAIISNICSRMHSWGPELSRSLVGALSFMSVSYVEQSVLDSNRVDGDRVYSQARYPTSHHFSQELRSVGALLEVMFLSITDLVFRSRNPNTRHLLCALMDQRECLFDVDGGISIMTVRNRCGSVNFRASAARLTQLLNRIETQCGTRAWESLASDARVRAVDSACAREKKGSSQLLSDLIYGDMIVQPTIFYFEEEKPSASSFLLAYTWSLVLNYSPHIDFNLDADCWNFVR
ncbi:hypothetical protein FVE85_0217 [Porphyridium purpureum]|uniref:Uncharacterized protein n=1 Tax=Porphyridium purpureum TaxID=35688 RepID=A0A5J4YZI3_PORPP|nr:hypothetical protein FVE85_0217 [Porphyridium purpureum]|eukprot:POR2195..scf208_2